MMMLLTGRLPKTADTVEWEGWRFEIVDMDGKTIDKVLATRLDREPSSKRSEASANPA
ncbi:Transporter associated domain protein [compost metagenome]